MISRHVWSVTSSILAIVTLLGLPTAGRAAYEDVKAVAEQGLQRWLSAIPESDIEGYGFKNKAELLQARVGEPYPIAVIDSTSLDSYIGTDINRLVRDVSTRLYVPVEIGGQIRALLDVTKRNGVWKIVAIGHAPMARRLELMRPLSPSGTEGRPRVIRVFLKNNSYQNLLAVKKGGRTLVSPFGPTTPALGAAIPSTKEFVEPKGILMRLRDIQRISTRPNQ